MAKGKPRWDSLSMIERLEKRWKQEGMDNESIERLKELYKKIQCTGKEEM